MFAFWSGEPKAPPRVASDRVVPVGFFDNTIIFRTFVLYTLFVFDDVLDPTKLRDSLERVVSRPGWDKLGARLRRNDQGELEHHIPAAFSRERPAVGFDHVDLSAQAVADHPAGRKIPRAPTAADARPAIAGDPDDLAELIHGDAVPTKLDDYLLTDRPQLGLRVVSFGDATVIVLHWIHLACDATAKRALLDAWMLALGGREAEIADPLPAEDYVLEHVGTQPSPPAKPHALADRHVSTPGLVSWALRNVLDLAIRPKEHRMVCVPAAYLARLRAKALAELADTEAPFVSEGDVLVAWTTRLALENLPKDSEKPIAVQQAYQWRPVLSDLIPAGRPFLSNCVGFLVTLLPAREILQQPLSYLAARVRATIGEQGTRGQVEAYTELIRRDQRNRAPPFFGDSSMQIFMFSNWQKANMYGVDLAAAAATPREKPLTPSYVQSTQGPYNFTDGIIIVGKDVHGNYWLSGYRVKGLWEMMEKKMANEEI